MILQVIHIGTYVCGHPSNRKPDVLTVTSPTASCGGCSIHIAKFELDWYQEVYTHVAATVVKFVNNDTNVTTTSTVQGGSFTLPRSARGDLALAVFDSVLTTNIGGTLYTL